LPLLSPFLYPFIYFIHSPYHFYLFILSYPSPPFSSVLYVEQCPYHRFLTVPLPLYLLPSFAPYSFPIPFISPSYHSAPVS
jgi:hypothetical protein